MNSSRMHNNTSTHSLQVYLKEIKHESLLTASEECTLAEAIARGDKDARSRMIQANLRLVVKIARDYVGRGMILEDLIGEGNLGLIRATEEFQPRFGTRFSTYAGYWIKQSIRHALINTDFHDSPARAHGRALDQVAPDRAHALSRTGSRAQLSRGGHDAWSSEVQKSLVDKALQARQLKLESTIASGAGWRSALGAAETYASPDASLEAGDEWDILASRMERLDTRERTILVLRYGLEGESPLTLKEIGRRLGITREWVRKIEIRAVRKLDNSDDHEPAGGPRPTNRRVSARGVPGGEPGNNARTA